MPCLFHANLFALGGARWHCRIIDVPNDYVHSFRAGYMQVCLRTLSYMG